MSILSRLRSKYQQWLKRVPIFDRVLIGNSIVIIFGAVFGTILTRHLAIIGDLKLILVFSSLGIILTLLVNFQIIRTALNPLQELRKAVDQVEEDQVKLPESLADYQDPNIHRLIIAINSMLMRLEKRSQQLRALSDRMINAQEEERVRISRGLHDETAQAIYTLLIHLDRLEASLPENSNDLRVRLAEIHKLAARMLENLRKIISDLRPSILDDLGLVPAIRWYAQSIFKEVDVGVTVESSLDNNEASRLPSHLKTTFFRVTQEALNNILRHANAHRVMIHLKREQSQIFLEVKDDGRGFDVDRTTGEAVYRNQLGLLGIHERVSLVGGEVKIESTPGQGTCLSVYVPVY